MKQGWEIKKIKDICEKASSNIAQNKITELDGDYPVFGASGFVQNVDFYHRDTEYIGIVKDGSGVGRVNIYPAYSSLLGTLQYIIPKQGYSLNFVAYALKSLKLADFASGAAIPHIYFKDYGEVAISVPSLAEQERIVEVLDREFEKIDAMKANAEQNLQHAKDLFQATLRQELQPKDGWITMKLGAFAHMKAGDFIKASDIKDEYFEGAYPCYGGNGLRGYVKEPNRNGEYCLIGRQGALCGNIHIANGVFRATEHAVVVSPYQKMPIKLIYYLLVALNLNQYSTGAAQPGLSVKNIADNVSISVPPQDIWNSVALRLGVIESNCTALEENYRKTITLCDDMKQALLRKAFNGEL